MRRFFLSSRGITLVSGVILMLCAGTPFMMAVFGSRVKAQFQLSQTVSAIVQTCAQVGLATGIVQGLFYDRFGARAASLLAGTLLMLAFFGVYLVLRMDLPVVLLATCFLLIGQGSHGMYTASAMTNIPNFAGRWRGSVMGLLAAAFGFSGALFAALETAVDPPFTDAAAVCQPPRAEQTNGTKGEVLFTTIPSSIIATMINENLTGVTSNVNLTTPTTPTTLLTTTAPLATSSNVFSTVNTADHQSLPFFLVSGSILFVVGILGALTLRRAPPGWQAVPSGPEDLAMHVQGEKTKGERGEEGVCETDVDRVQESLPAGDTRKHVLSHTVPDLDDSRAELLGNDPLQHRQDEVTSAPEHIKPHVHFHPEVVCEGGPGSGDGWQRDIYGWALLRNVDFWLLFWALSIDDGTAVMFLNALPSMRAAAGSDSTAPDSNQLVAVFALCNALGRFGWGLLSDRFEHAREFVLCGTIIGMLSAHLLLLMWPGQLLAASVLVGIFFGGLLSLAPVIVSDLFGFAHFGTNWGVIVIAPAVCSLAMGAVYGRIYDQHADPVCHHCAGTSCYQPVYGITSLLLALACVLSAALGFRNRRRRTG
eukprot:m.68155 g.68155  ORF g.68155 m.68155 type:complete len:593 (-) comp12755_c0_seq2:42-1820(-)